MRAYSLSQVGKKVFDGTFLPSCRAAERALPQGSQPGEGGREEENIEYSLQFSITSS